ncbi:MAG: elongation factor G [Cyanophyceae cyanobacterium]
MSATVGRTRRNIALIGPYSSGKTTLLESLLFVSGILSRKGSTKDGNSVGDSSPEARDRGMGVEVNVASHPYQDLEFTWIDCPGSVELAAETYSALVGVDAAVVVCEPNVNRATILAPLFQFLDAWEIPHLLFINKLDRANNSISEILAGMQTVSSRPLVLHQYPIRENREVVGFIDLVTEQAYHYHAGAPADPVPLPESMRSLEQTARQEMLEVLADYDDHLLEELLEDITPTEAEIVGDLRMELGADLIVPVFVGMADRDFGTRPLLDALVREAPETTATAQRRGIETIDLAGVPEDAAIAQVLKTYYTSQGGKLSLVRLWQGILTDSDTLNGDRIGGLYRLQGGQTQPIHEARAGDILAITRLEHPRTGDTLSSAGDILPSLLPRAELPEPVYAMAVVAEKRSDEVKLSSALAKLTDEDPGLSWQQHGDTHEVVLAGQGEIHLQIALDRLKRKYNLPMTTHLPQVPYRETIRKGVGHVHGRYKHQTGGHGQFGDVYLDINPLPRGAGFDFSSAIVGGVVPRQYIPGVEMGVRESLDRGPLGFPVVDVAVKLTDGSYHTVDSSEQAFKQAARAAMQAAMADCGPVLLEPIALVEISAPAEFTAKVLQLISGRRGQILGYTARPDWSGWETVSAHMPQVEMQDLIVELRSQTLGVGTFSWRPERLQEVPDKLAERILAQATGDRA